MARGTRRRAVAGSQADAVEERQPESIMVIEEEHDDDVQEIQPHNNNIIAQQPQPILPMAMEQHAAALLASTQDFTAHLVILRAYLEDMEIFRQAEYLEQFINTMLPSLLAFLLQCPVSLSPDIHHEVRYMALTLISRVPISPLLSPKLEDLFNVLFQVIQTDNEPNGVAAIQFLSELFKNFATELQPKISAFLQFAASLYSNVRTVIGLNFNSPSDSSTFRRAINSFQVLAKCPGIISFLYNVHQDTLQSAIVSLIHVMVSPFKYPVPQQHAQSHKQEFIDHIDMLVKTLSCLLSFSRAELPEVVRMHSEDIGKTCITLILTCPKEASQSRKELLNCIRQFLKTDVKRSFFKQIDVLLDEKTLLGQDCPNLDIFRPLVYSMIGDLVKNMKGEFQAQHLVKLVHMLGRNVHDMSLPYSIQILSVKRLIDLIDNVYQQNDPNYCRSLLVRIVNCFVDKFETLKDLIPGLIQNSKSYFAEPADERLWITAYQSKAEENLESLLLEIQQLMNFIVQGLKPAVWCVTQAEVRAGVRLYGLQPEESEVMGRFLDYALQCFGLYQELSNNLSASSFKSGNPAGAKDFLEPFADVFSVLDTASFRRVLGQRMPALFEFMLTYEQVPTIMSIPKLFLGNQTVSRTFADILLIFILDRLDVDLSSVSSSCTTLILNLFGTLINSLAIFQENENVVRPYVKTLMEKLLDKIDVVDDPEFYLRIMQKLFRGLAGGRYENFYQELLTILERILRTLLKLFDTLDPPPAQVDLILELCLTVPARISSLLSVMPLSVQAVLRSLKSSSDLVVKLGLRTLDFWVGKIKHEFLFLQMGAHLPAIMHSLCDLLRPQPALYGMQVIKILGRLGGRNRAFLLNEMQLKPKNPPEDSLTMDIHMLEPIPDLCLPLADCAQDILSLFDPKAPPKDAVCNLLFCFLKSSIFMLFDYSVSDSHLASSHLGSWKRLEKTSEWEKFIVETRYKMDAQDDLLETLLYRLLLMGSIASVYDDVHLFAVEFSRHIAILLLGFRADDGHVDIEEINFNPSCIFNVMRRLMCSKNSIKVQDIGKAILQTLVTTLTDNCGVQSAADTLALRLIFHFLVKSCYETNIASRRVGCVGLHLLVFTLDDSWVKKNCNDIIRSLIFTFSSEDENVSSELIGLSQDALQSTIKSYLKDIDLQDSKESAKIIRNLVSAIFHDAISPIPRVRDMSFLLLEQIAGIVENPLAELLKPIYQQFLDPILKNSLDNVSVCRKIGFFSATSKCLLLKPPLISPTPELMKLLQDTVTYVLKEDRTQQPISSSSSGKKLVEQFIKLRVEAVKLISVALVSPALKEINGDQRQIKAQITLALFRSLMHNTKEVVEAAKYGLGMVTSQETLPKELLQECLRPILLNLADARKLNNHLLKLLEHLLELLSSCFNATLGEKLLDHLYFFSEALKAIVQEQSQSSSVGSSSSRTLQDLPALHEVRIPTTIIHLFHLLPPAPRQFLTKLVMNVVNLEGILPRLRTYGENCVGASSPFRKPLMKFLCKYAAESVAFFLTPKNLVERTLSQMFLSVLRSPEGQAVRKALMFAHDQLLAATFNIEQTQRNSSDQRRHVIPAKAIDELQLQGINIVHILAEWHPEWLSRCPKVVRCLLACWRAHSMNISREVEIPHEHVTKWKLIAECLMIFCAQNKSNVGVLWTLLPAFLHRTLVDYSFLSRFFKEKIAEDSSGSEKAAIIREFFANVLLRPNLYAVLKVKGIQHVIYPITQSAVKSGQADEVFEQPIMEVIVTEALSDIHNATYSDDVKIELIRMYTAMLECITPPMVVMIPRVLEYCWNICSTIQEISANNDSALQTLQLHACLFISKAANIASDFREDMVAFILQRMLMAHSLESQALVDSILDTLMSSVPRESFLHIILQALYQNDQSTTILSHIYSAIVRNKAHSYYYRSALIPQIVVAITRLGISERLYHRKVALNLISVVIEWEKRRRSAGDVDGEVAEDVKSVFLTFLIRLSLLTCENAEAQPLSRRCLVLIKNLYEISDYMPVDIGFIVRAIHKSDSSALRYSLKLNLFSTSIEIIQLLLSKCSEDLIQSNMDYWKSFFILLCDSAVLSLKKESFEILNSLAELHADPKYRETVNPLFSYLITLFHELQSKFFMEDSQRCTDHFLFIIDMLCCLPTFYARSVFHPLLSYMQKLVSEVILSQQDSRLPDKSNEKIPIVSLALKRIMNWIWKNRNLIHDANSKASLLSSFVNILESSCDADSCETVARILLEWAELEMRYDLDGLPPLQLNEKVQLVFKLAAVKGKTESTMNDLLRFCLTFFSASWRTFPPDVRTQLQSIFYMGLRSNDESLRRLFFADLRKLSGNSLFECLSFLLGGEYWVINDDSNEWLNVAVSLLLQFIDWEKPLNRRKSSGRTVLSPYSDYRHHDLQSSMTTKDTSTSEIVDSHKSFVRSLHLDLRISSILGPLDSLQLCYYDSLSFSVWKSLFPQIWKSFSSEEKNRITRLLANVLSICPQKKSSRLTFQAFLVGINEVGLICEEEVNIHCEILLFAAQQHNCFVPIMQRLERQLVSFPADDSSFLSVLELLQALSETDSYFGLLQTNMKSAHSKTALALSQFSLWPRAQSVYFNAMKTLRMESSVSDYEHQTWEKEWVRCAKNLNQWTELADYAKVKHNPTMEIDAGWRLGEWDAVRKIASSPELVDNGETALQRLRVGVHSAFAKATTDLNSISEDFKELRDLAEKSFSSALSQWNDLPKFCGTHHIPLLMSFQEIVELQESIEMLTVACKSIAASLSQGQQSFDLKPYLVLWRERLPNEWESIPVWSDLLTWRNHVFFSMADLARSHTMLNPPASDYQDCAWTIVKYAEIARKQQLPAVCLAALGNLNKVPHPLHPDEIFSKICEQVKICMGMPNENHSAINLINLTDIDNFTDEQRAELFCLKGQALTNLGLGEDSHAAFSASVSVCEEYGEAWLSWAGLHDQVFSMKKELQWAQYAVACYLQAIKFNSSFNIRLMLSRVLWLLSFDSPKYMVISKIFEKYAESLPLWIWLLWVPQLLSSLPRVEGFVLKKIIEKLGVVYPQAVYFGVRAYYFEKREVLERKDLTDNSTRDATEGGPPRDSSHEVGEHTSLGADGSDPPSDNSLKLVSDILLAIRVNQPNLVFELDKMLDEIQKKFKAMPEEELLGAVYALFLRCFKHVSENPEEIWDHLREIIDRVCHKFFRLLSGTTSTRSKKIQQFVFDYRERFLQDFHRDEGRFPENLSELISRLKKWKVHLQYQLQSKNRTILSLHRLSQELMRFQGYGIEIPGQYLQDEEPRINMNVTLEHFLPTVRVVHAHGFAYRQLGMLGSDGKVYQFLVQVFVSHITKSDERMAQFYVILNRIMSKSKETRDRQLAFSIPLAVPVTHRLRLVYVPDELQSLESLYERCCYSRGWDPDEPLVEYRSKLIATNAVALLPSCTGEIANQVYESRSHALSELMTTSFPNMKSMLRDFFQQITSDYEEWWVIRKEFARQVALSAFLTYVMQIGDRTLHKISISLQSGRLINWEFYPNYNAQQHIDGAEPVPFRLSPNMTEFIGPFLLKGLVGGTVIGSAACVLKHQDIVKNFLYLFLRDDMLSWNATRNPKILADDQTQRNVEQTNRVNVLENTLRILQRVQMLMAASGGENSDAELTPINEQADRLISVATRLDSLGMMNPIWHPWF